MIHLVSQPSELDKLINAVDSLQISRNRIYLHLQSPD